MQDKEINKILLVVNPVSGNTDKEPLIDLVRNAMTADMQLSILQTIGKNDIRRITDTISDFGPHRILAMGGDGTLKEIAEANKSTNVVMGVLPAGSANGLATALKLPNTVEQALPIALGDTILNLDVVCVNDQLCLHIGDLGLNAELIKNYKDSGVRGYFGYAMNVIPTLINTGMPYQFTIKANGQTLNRQAIVIAFTNVTKYGTGAVINPVGIADDGKFELLIFKKFDIVEILKTLSGNITLKRDFIEVISTNKATIFCNNPVDLQVDGEAYGIFQELEVSLSPVKLRIAVASEAK